MKLDQIIRTTFTGRIAGECGYDIELAEPGSGGGVAFDPKSNRLVSVRLDGSSSPEARTVRVHESDHVKYSPRNSRENALLWGDKGNGLDFAAINFLEDARISHPLIWQDRPARVRADAIALVLEDLKKCEANLLSREISQESKVYNAALGIALRSMSMLSACGYGSKVRVSEWPLFANYAIVKTAQVLWRVRGMIHGSTPLHRPASGWRECHKLKADRMLYLEPALKLFLSLLLPPDALPAGTNPVAKPMDDGTTSAVWDRVTVQKLPLAIDTLAHARNITRLPAMSGPRLRRGSLVQIAVGIPGQHFIRRIVHASPNGAAVMIDVSGSMKISQEDLESLSAQIPAGFIACYCQEEASDEDRGQIVVYADQGRRALTIPARHASGNGCDYAALLMLLSRPESPKILVSDLGFGGGPASDICKAHVLCERERNAGRLIVAPSIQSAIATLNGKEEVSPDEYY